MYEFEMKSEERRSDRNAGLKMEQIPFAAMNNGNVKIIVTARRYSLTHFAVILKIWVELLGVMQIREENCGADYSAHSYTGYESNDYLSRNSEIDADINDGNQRFNPSQSRSYLSFIAVVSIFRLRFYRDS